MRRPSSYRPKLLPRWLTETIAIISFITAMAVMIFFGLAL